MIPITYLVGDCVEAALHADNGNQIVAHIVNRAGGWGRGFVLAVSKAWKEPERRYRSWAHGYAVNDAAYIPLGAVQYVSVSETVTVANMVGQFGPGEGIYPPVRYDAVEACLIDLAGRALRTNASVRMPRITCGLAGGTWDQTEPLIIATLCAQGVPVYVYDLPARTAKTVESEAGVSNGQGTLW